MLAPFSYFENFKWDQNIKIPSDEVRENKTLKKHPFFKQNDFFYVFFLEGAVFFSEYAVTR